MELLLLIFLPLTGALLTSIFGQSPHAKKFALGISAVSFLHILFILFRFVPDTSIQFAARFDWINPINARFYAGIDGINIIPVLLTNLLVPIIILTSFKHNYRNPGAFYALLLFMQSGMLVVFTALDAFLFYVGWEAALIPIYFICALWGGENRIRVTIKFFIYTFAGSIIMLIAIIFLALQTPDKGFTLSSFYALELDPVTQGWIFAAFFLAFAIKMPVFPLHTWQPDTYTISPAPGTMMLSGIMLKMGVYGAIRWLIPVAPLGFLHWGKTALLLAVTGIVYASLIAFTRKNMKRLIAYSSIAHVGLIAAGIFAWNIEGVQGGMIQMLSHGINVVGLFFIADLIFSRMATHDLNAMGGIAKNAPRLAIGAFIIVAGTVALPLTNGFIGEFLLLMGVYKYSLWASIMAGLTIILGAVYMLRMYQRAMLGDTSEQTGVFKDIEGTELLVMILLGALIIAVGVYPKPLLSLSEAAVTNLVNTVNAKIQVVKF